MENNQIICNILLVEDNPADALLIKELLGQIDAAKYKTNSVLDMKSAIDFLNSEIVDVILLDLNLPDSDGIDTVKSIKSVARNTPIITVTSLNDEELTLQCLKEGVQDYLIKGRIDSLSLRLTISYSILRQKESKLEELQELLEHYRGLSSKSSQTTITASLSGAGSIQDSSSSHFNNLVNDYKELLQIYIKQIIVKNEKPKIAMERLITQLGDVGGGPRDLLDIHVSALDKLMDGKETLRTKSLALEGRLLALEMMGLLVDYYRVGNRRRYN